MQVQALEREFKYNSVKLADPNPAFTLAQVRDFFANVYPEIISADIEGPEVVGNKNVYSFRRAVGTKGNTAAMRAMMEPRISIDDKLLEGRNSITVQQVAFELLKLPLASRKTLAEISHQMAKLGWKRGHNFPGGRFNRGMENWCFSRDIEPAGVPEQVVVPTRQQISDLDALHQIGWFHADPYAVYVIRQAVDAVKSGAPINLVLQLDVGQLHALHCSRSQEVAA
jgi:PRTRC genetic system protein C